MKLTLVNVAIVLCSAIIGAAAAEQKPPGAILEEVAKLRTDRVAEAKAANKTPDYVAIAAEATARAAAALKGVDPSKVDLSQAKEWVQVFNAARDYKGARAVAERWASQTTGKEQFDARLAMMSADFQMKDARGLLRTLEQTRPVDAATSNQLASTARSYVLFGFSNADKPTAMSILGVAERSVPRAGFATDRERQAAATTRESVEKTRKLIEENPGKEAEVLEKERRNDFVKLLTARAGGSTNAARAREEREARFASLIGNDAKELSPTHKIGDVPTLAQMRGKVVMLDFFAHWCGPCIASLPSVRSLSDDLKERGFQVLGVTRFYGYYASESRAKRDMPPASELERMRKFVEEKKINWPVAFVDRPVFDAYACTAIPHVVLIDKQGKIRQVKVGYNPGEVAEFRKAIEKLLAE